jgi:formylglycine-generating enzyme required for sulfatase activity
MRRWFLSYNSQDFTLMQAFEETLRRKDTDSQIFFAPKSLRAGGYWLKQLADEIAQATTVVLLIGERGLGRWQFDEYCEARDCHVPVVLVLLEGQPAPGLPMLRQLHWIVTTEPASEQTVARVIASSDVDVTRPQALWRYATPYRGLAAMTESDMDFFFGRGRETVEVIRTLVSEQRALPILLGNSGVGKSSLAQAGVLAALRQQAWPETVGNSDPWPRALGDSRRWCVLKLKPGTEPIRSLVEPFLRTWQFDPTDPRLEARQADWIESLIEGKNTLKGLLNGTEDRLQELGKPKPPAFLIYIDQGEELYVRADERQRQCFSNLLAQGLSDSRLRALMSMRADFLGELQKDESLYMVHRQINVPPLREAELRDVVSQPAELLSAKFETPRLVDIITRRTAEDSVKDVGALPLLSYTLDDMWTEMLKRDDGVLRLPAQSFELGGVLVDRADGFVANHPKSLDELRRIFTLKLANVREGEEPTRRRALRSEFSDEEWLLVCELADHPNRILVTATSAAGETYAEVAHEAIFRRWAQLRGWIAAEREFLAWRTGLETARRVWQTTPDNSKNDALLAGLPLTQASGWRDKRPQDIAESDRKFIGLSRKVMRRRRQRVRAFVGMLVAAIVAVLAAWSYQQALKESFYWLTNVRGYVLTAEREHALRPKESFRECVGCPEMVLVPAGEFMMGSKPDEKGRYSNEGPVHNVTIAKPFAVAKFELTFDEWDACAAHGDCDSQISDSGWGRGRQPVINVSWHDATRYAAWLSRITGQPYRLLTEAEWEYAARAGTTTRYSFGDDEAALGQYAWNRLNSGGRTHPVGEKRPNAFGLYDMHGNVWEWVQDCYQSNYEEAATDGSARMADNCDIRSIRGGSWTYEPTELRAAERHWSYGAAFRDWGLGVRVARTITPKP